MTEKETLLSLITELQATAQIGLAYSKDPYDIERFKQIRNISFELLALKSDLQLADIKEAFSHEVGYPTPKVGTRAAIFKDDKILLVRETADGLWSLPGGWCDYNQSIKENIIKEVKEEAGLNILPTRLVTVSSREMKIAGKLFNLVRFFILCDFISGEFEASMETDDYGYFGLDNLPEISVARNSYELIALCFKAKMSETWETIFD